MPPTVADLRRRATRWPKGRYFEDFDVGQVLEHHWGRTVTEADNTLFTTLTLGYNPRYFNLEFARELGLGGVVVNPMLVFLVVFGLSVEDLSEAGGAFLGVDGLVFHRAVRAQDTLTARSTVVARRESSSRPSQGIVTWHTEGRRQDGELIVEFRRTNLIPKREAGR